ncbi:MAG TPA: class I SAM-dependent methyltransferase [candidate division Zixibacteria bacterium]|nr:class I SAM-dependent methyltransferase [candidate division Zixibacteria bacterium]
MANQDNEKNRVAWNEMAGVHFDHPDYRVKEFLEGRSTLKSIEIEELGDVSEKSLLHLFCQFGLDTLSWARRDAIVTGVDISDTSIELAENLTRQSGLRARWVRTDVLDLRDKLDEKFDIVFQSYGTHHWIEDLNKWAEIVSHFLKPGGRLYMVDLHPIMGPWLESDVSYFKKGPYLYSNEVDYCNKDYIVRSEHVEWQHKLADIVSALIDTGLTIEYLHEFDKCCYPRERDWYEKDGYYYPPEGPTRFPQLFSLSGRKR